MPPFLLAEIFCTTKQIRKNNTTMPSMLEQNIEAMIAPSIEALGYGVVRVKLMEGAPQTLQIMAERVSDGGLNLDNCTEISHAVSAILDVEDPIKSEYNLEVSSPGVDRPLVKLADFERYVGHEAKLTTQALLDGQKRFTGTIAQVNNNVVVVKGKEQDASWEIPLEQVETAKLVITDKLLKQYEKEIANDG